MIHALAFQIESSPRADASVPFTGGRGDIATAIAWKGGKWTAVIARKLVTGSKTEVQFDDLNGTYEFGLAAFDNAQMRHAVHFDALKLRFGK